MLFKRSGVNKARDFNGENSGGKHLNYQILAKRFRLKKVSIWKSNLRSFAVLKEEMPLPRRQCYTKPIHSVLVRIDEFHLEIYGA